MTKLAVMMKANQLTTLFAMMGYQTTFSVGQDKGTKEIDVTVFFDDENQRNHIERNMLKLMDDGDAMETKYHSAKFPEGSGWVTYTKKYEI